MSETNTFKHICTPLLLFSLLTGFIAGCQALPPVESAGPVSALQEEPPTLAAVAQVPLTATGTATPLPTVPVTSTPLPTPTMVPTRPTLTPRPTGAPPLLATSPPPAAAGGIRPLATVTYPPLDPDYIGRSIEELTARTYGSGSFRLVEEIEMIKPRSYLRFTFEYESDNGEIVEGFLNVPREGEKFPVAIVLHGYVDPDKYLKFAYTTVYANALAEAGYMTFHPSYRNHPPTGDNDPYNTFRVDYAVDVLHLVSYIQNLSQDPSGPLRRADGNHIHLMGHSMGGGIAQRVMTVRPEAFKAVVLYGSMSGDEQLNYAKIQEWAGERIWFKEAGAPSEIIAAVSPLYFIERWSAPVSIHHGGNDTTVPPAWSADLCRILTALRHPVECFEYVNYPHTLYGPAEELFIERMIRFFKAN